MPTTNPTTGLVTETVADHAAAAVEALTHMASSRPNNSMVADAARIVAAVADNGVDTVAGQLGSSPFAPPGPQPSSDDEDDIDGIVAAFTKCMRDGRLVDVTFGDRSVTGCVKSITAQHAELRLVVGGKKKSQRFHVPYSAVSGTRVADRLQVTVPGACPAHLPDADSVREWTELEQELRCARGSAQRLADSLDDVQVDGLRSIGGVQCSSSSLVASIDCALLELEREAKAARKSEGRVLFDGREWRLLRGGEALDAGSEVYVVEDTRCMEDPRSVVSCGVYIVADVDYRGNVWVKRAGGANSSLISRGLIYVPVDTSALPEGHVLLDNREWRPLRVGETLSENDEVYVIEDTHCLEYEHDEVPKGRHLAYGMTSLRHPVGNVLVWNEATSGVSAIDRNLVRVPVTETHTLPEGHVMFDGRKWRPLRDGARISPGAEAYVIKDTHCLIDPKSEVKAGLYPDAYERWPGGDVWVQRADGSDHDLIARDLIRVPVDTSANTEITTT